jgi:hypothetical protein
LWNRRINRLACARSASYPETPLLNKHAGRETQTPDPGAWLAFFWLLGLTAVILAPYLRQSPTLGDDLTRYTVRLALACYAVAATLMLLLRPDEQRGNSPRARLARWCWTFAWATYLVHLAMAFHHYHHWSHAAAVEHTEAVSGFGKGIYLSHLFTLVWTADVLFWWLRPGRHAGRSSSIDWLLHGFMVFIIFNATVTYETGPIRWAGLALFTGLAGVWIYRRQSGWSHPAAKRVSEGPS